MPKGEWIWCLKTPIYLLSFIVFILVWTCKNYVMVLCVVCATWTIFICKTYLLVWCRIWYYLSCDAYGWCNVISHFIVVLILSYASRLYYYTKALVCKGSGGAYLNMCIGIWGHFEIFMHIFRGSSSIFWLELLYFIPPFLSPNWYCHQSPKRGRLKVHLGP